jgi:hypothetical protein
MSLLSGDEVAGHTNVQLLRTTREPHPSAPARGQRLCELLQAEQVTVEVASAGLAARGRSDLHVIESDDRHWRTVANPARGPLGRLSEHYVRRPQAPTVEADMCLNMHKSFNLGRARDPKARPPSAS